MKPVRKKKKKKKNGVHAISIRTEAIDESEVHNTFTAYIHIHVIIPSERASTDTPIGSLAFCTDLLPLASPLAPQRSCRQRASEKRERFELKWPLASKCLLPLPFAVGEYLVLDDFPFSVSSLRLPVAAPGTRKDYS